MKGKIMKTKLLTAALLLAVSTSSTYAQQLEITVTNLTQGLYYTPLLVSAHNSDVTLFSLGEVASPELQAMAEGGDISGLSAMLSNANATSIENPAAGLLAPAMSTTTMLDTAEGNNYLSIVAMLLPTNDGFIGLNSWEIPSEVGTYTFTLNAYDAGTEANNEVINGGGAPGVLGIPADPSGKNGTGATGVTMAEDNNKVHIHRGNLGDDDLSGGKSDLVNSVHRWLNPVARVTVKVM